jgi:hypothetical protein
VAYADAPANDSWEAATEVTALPFEDSVDTTEATTDAVNPPGTGQSYNYKTVWYHFTGPDVPRVLVSTAGTDYEHALMLYRADSAGQSPDEWTEIQARGGGGPRGAGMVLPLEKGKDYYLEIGSYNPSGDPADDQSVGGTLHLLIREPAHVTYSIARFGKYDRVDGSATLHGIVQTDQPTTVYITAGLRQLVGGQVVSSQAGLRMGSEAEPTTWRLRLGSDRPFKRGPARIYYSQLRFYDMGIPIGRFQFERDTVDLR